MSSIDHPPEVHLLRRVGGRVGWGLADQALSSLTNFALGLMVARTLGAREFGAFSLAFATYTVAMGVSRALSTEPLVVRYSGSSRSSWRVASRAATGTALVVGIAFGFVCAAVSVLLPGAMQTAFLVLGVAMPGLLLQDSWRFVFFAGGKGEAAFANDLVWTLTLLPALGVFAALGWSSVGWLTLAWGGAAGIAALVGILQIGATPRPAALREWWKQHGDLSSRFVGEFMTLSGAGQLSLYGIGAVAGLAALGSLRAGLLLLGPLNVLFMGIGMVAVPEGVRLLKTSVERFHRATIVLSLSLGAAALLWGGAVLVIPDRIGTEILRSTWLPARSVVVPLTIWMTATGLMAGAVAGLRALGAAHRSLKARFITSSLTTASGVIGAAQGGARGAAWGGAIALCFGAVVWWRWFRQEMSSFEPAPMAVSDGLLEGSLLE
jgi:O-antigen/teichoic acid export membrane protein